MIPVKKEVVHSVTDKCLLHINMAGGLGKGVHIAVCMAVFSYESCKCNMCTWSPGIFPSSVLDAVADLLVSIIAYAEISTLLVASSCLGHGTFVLSEGDKKHYST